MKHLKHIATVCLLIVTAACSRPNPHRAIYERYAEADNLTVAFVGGYRVNDSLRVDVTFLQAEDTAGWNLLKKDFSIIEIELPDEYKHLAGFNNYDLKYTPKGHPEQPMDTSNLLNNDLLIIDFSTQTVSVFHIEYEKQVSAILAKETQRIKN